MKRADKIIINLDAADIKAAIACYVANVFAEMQGLDAPTVTLSKTEGADFAATVTASVDSAVVTVEAAKAAMGALTRG